MDDYKPTIMKPGKWTRREQSFLMYLESCLVDNYGMMEGVRFNKEEADWASEWTKLRLIEFGRIAYKDIRGGNTHWVRFSDDAWELAHRFRRERSDRMLKDK